MEKNSFLLFNDLVYQLYSEPSFQHLKTIFLKRLKTLVPYSYASIMMTCGKPYHLKLTDPVCNPSSFQKAESEYIRIADMDHLEWIMYSSETVLVWEGEVFKDRQRLSSPVYQKCYSHYDIYDTIQMSIVYNRKVYGILTLYRTHADPAFSNEDIFYIRAFSKHLNFLFYQHLDGFSQKSSLEHLAELEEKYKLTKREAEILQYILQGMNNLEIIELIDITEHTLQKHLQNLYRKCGVSTRWDLLKLS